MLNDTNASHKEKSAETTNERGGVYMKYREQLCNLLNNIILTERNPSSAILKSELIEKGKMSNSTINNIVFGRTHVDSLDVSALYWIYSAIKKIKSDLPDVKHFFEEIEIKKAEREREKTIQSQFPLIFIADQLKPKQEFNITLPIKNIIELQKSGIIQIDAAMQRESEILIYNGQLISHVSYDDSKAREISKLLLSREYSPDPIRLNLVKDIDAKYIYDSDTKKLIIHGGNIVLLDGQHRMRAMEYALIQEPELEYSFPVIFSVATVKKAQGIIAQHEKLQPINKNLIKTYQSSVAGDIVRKLEIDDNISSVYIFVDTIQALYAKAGFVLAGDIIDAINEYYKVSDFSLKEQSELIKWLIEFFMEVANYMEDDFKNFRSIKNRWSISRHIFPAYIWLSAVLEDNIKWKDELRKLINSLDFDMIKRPWSLGASKPDRYIINKFKEVLGYVD